KQSATFPCRREEVILRDELLQAAQPVEPVLLERHARSGMTSSALPGDRGGDSVDRHGVGRENVGRQPFAQVLFRAGEGCTAVPEASVAEQQSEQIRRKQERTAAGREFDRGNERNPGV